MYVCAFIWVGDDECEFVDRDLCPYNVCAETESLRCANVWHVKSVSECWQFTDEDRGSHHCSSLYLRSNASEPYESPSHFLWNTCHSWCSCNSLYLLNLSSRYVLLSQQVIPLELRHDLWHMVEDGSYSALPAFEETLSLSLGHHSLEPVSGIDMLLEE